MTTPGFVSHCWVISCFVITLGWTLAKLGTLELEKLGQVGFPYLFIFRMYNVPLKHA